MLRRLAVIGGSVLAAWWTAPTAAAQTAPLAPARPVAIAIAVEEPPALDGDVLGDPAWARATPVGGFWQTTPDDGQPASQRTEVRVVYTARSLYFGVVCYDSQPNSIIVADSRRDSPLTETDSVQIILDTYRDGQNGFVFGTNPAGIEYDGQVAREGADSGGPGRGGGRQQAGSGGGFNINWDGAWEVRTRVTDAGWTAEFEIPFRTLRYSPGQPSWSVNFQRNIRRRNERAFWAPLDRQHDLFRLVDAGTLTGLALPPQRNLKVSPYVLGESVDEHGAGGSGRTRGRLGGDAKYSLTPSLTLDLTLNTDFAQVEVDEEQINLDRFNLFFPEKRPFFLENAGLFSVGRPGEVEIFFSRRIGIAGDQIIPIRAGGRLTGRVAGVNVGLLNMQTAAERGLTPGNNFSVARVSRDFQNRSSIGGIFVNRTATASLEDHHRHNRTAAIDGRLGVGRNGLLQGFAARTSTPGVEAEEYAYGAGARYESEAWRLTADYTEVSDAFNPEVGFLARRGYRNPELLAFHTRRLANNRFKLLEIRPHVSYRGYWNFAGVQETGHLHMDSHWVWRSANEVHTGLNVTRQGVTQPFEIYPGVLVPIGTYDHNELQLVGNTNRGAPVSVDSRIVAGGFFGGRRVSTTAGVNARLGETFNTTVSWNRNDVNLPSGEFVTNLLRTRVSYSFSPRIYLQALLQYNDRADIWSTNLRFGWLQASNTGLFVVLNDTVDLADPDFGRTAIRRTGRTLTVKYSRLFDLLR